MVQMLTLPLLFVLQASTPIHAGDDGATLYQTCLAAVRAFDNPASPSQADIKDSHSCYAYIQGFVDGSNIDGPAFCPEGGTLGTSIRVYVTYMQKNPKLFDQYKAEGVFRAFREAYPCPAKAR